MFFCFFWTRNSLTVAVRWPVRKTIRCCISTIRSPRFVITAGFTQPTQGHGNMETRCCYLVSLNMSGKSCCFLMLRRESLGHGPKWICFTLCGLFGFFLFNLPEVCVVAALKWRTFNYSCFTLHTRETRRTDWRNVTTTQKSG